jgi:micrococcal nuclease
MKPFRIILPLILLFFVVSSVAAQTGKVVGVSDGDTITVLVNKAQVKVRLYGIDCPEGGQDYGRRAKQFTSGMVFGKTVTLEIHDTDRYGRSVANVLIDGKSLNEELVKAGYAWVYPQYCKTPVCQKWYKYESEARAQKIGLWSHPNPIPPWDYRRGKASTINRDSKVISAGVYRGNTRSMVFHQASCKDFSCKNCTEVFQRPEDAVKAGYRACGRCGP